MKTQKFGTDYQANAHFYARADKDEKGENYGSRMFFENDIMYSYRYSFIICKKIRDKKNNVQFILFSNDTASVTTSKQQNAVRSALFQKIINVNTDIEYFNPLKEVKAKVENIINTNNKYHRARAEYIKQNYNADMLQDFEDIKFLVDYYRIKSKLPTYIKDIIKADDDTFIQLVDKLSKRKETADKVAETRQLTKNRIQREKDIEKSKERIEKWKNHEVEKLYSNYTGNDFLRVSKDKTEIETSQAVTIKTSDAIRLLKLIDAKKIIGAKVGDKYDTTVTAFNGVLKAGCHNITIEEINRIRKQIM